MKHIKLFEEFSSEEITLTNVDVDQYYEILSTEITDDELESMIARDEKKFNIKIEMNHGFYRSNVFPKSGPVLFNLTGQKKDLLNFLRIKLDSTYAMKKLFPELYESENFVNEGSSIHIENVSDVDHTRIVKWMSNQFFPTAGIKKSGSGFTIDTHKLSKDDQDDLINYLKSGLGLSPTYE